MPGKIPSQMTFTRLSNAAVTMDTVLTMDTNGKVGPAATGSLPLGVALCGASAAGQEVSVDPGPAIANLTIAGAVTANDRVIGAASGQVKKYTGQTGQTVTVANATDIWTATGHGFTTGEAVRLSNSGGGLPANSSATTTYYVSVIDANTFKLYTSRANAIAAGATGLLDVSGDGTGTQTIRLYDEVWVLGIALETQATAGAKVAVLWQPYPITLP